MNSSNILLILSSSLIKGMIFYFVWKLINRFSLFARTTEKCLLLSIFLLLMILPLGIPYLNVSTLEVPSASGFTVLNDFNSPVSSPAATDVVPDTPILTETQEFKLSDAVTSPSEISGAAYEWDMNHLLYFYFAITFILLLWKTGEFVMAKMILRKLPSITDDKILSLGMAHNICKDSLINIESTCSTPASTGIFRRIFLLPETRLMLYSDLEISYLLSHEQAHFSYADNISKPILHFVGALFWFNPFFFLIRRDLFKLMEQRCDEKVISDFGMAHSEKITYIKLLTNFSFEDGILYTNNLGCNAKILKERLERIMNYSKTVQSRRKLLFISAACALALTFAMPLIGGADTSPSPEAIKLEKPYTLSPETPVSDLRWATFGLTAKELIGREKYEEALGMFVWWWDNILKHDPSQSGIRSSFFLYDWNLFASKYPKALSVLKDIRERNAKLLMKGDQDSKMEYFADILAIDQVIFDTEATYKLFLELDKKNPQTAEKVWPYIRHTAIQRGDVKRALKYTPAFEHEWETVLSAQKKILSDIKAAKDSQTISNDISRMLQAAEDAIQIFSMKKDAVNQRFVMQCKETLSAFLANDEIKPFISAMTTLHPESRHTVAATVERLLLEGKEHHSINFIVKDSNGNLVSAPKIISVPGQPSTIQMLVNGEKMMPLNIKDKSFGDLTIPGSGFIIYARTKIIDDSTVGLEYSVYVTGESKETGKIEILWKESKSITLPAKLFDGKSLDKAAGK